MYAAQQTMNNSDFLAEVYRDIGPNEFGWVTTFRADPNNCPPSSWDGRPYDNKPQQAQLIDRAAEDNAYFSTAILKPDEDGQIGRRKANFARLAVLALDDVDPFQLPHHSYALETSPGKWQVGIFLDRDDPDCADLGLVDAVMQAIAVRGKAKRGNDTAGNAIVRYVRLPSGSNTKPRAAGMWRVQMRGYYPNVRWSLEDACAAFGLDLAAIRAAADARAKTQTPSTMQGTHAGEFLAGLSAPLSDRQYHDNIRDLAASLIAGGMYPSNAVSFLYSVMDAVRPHGNEQEIRRWEARRAEVPRAVKSAEKFAPPDRRSSVTVNLGLPTTEEGEPDTSGLLLSLGDLASRASNVKWQIKHLIPQDAVGILFGASGTFKSFVALDHCLHVAHGIDWMGKRTKKGAVVYVAAEGGAGIYRRIAAWHRHHGRSLPDNFFVCITPMVLSNAQHIEALAKSISALPQKPSLIYIDTLSQTYAGDENDNAEMADYLRSINSVLRVPFSATVVVVHHTGHAATERPRGASSLEANADFTIGVYRPDAGQQVARLDVSKQKDDDKLQGLHFEMARHVLDTDEDGEEISSLIACYKDVAGGFVAQAVAKLSRHEQALITELTAAGGRMGEADLRHRFYDAVGEECRRAGKPYLQDSAKRQFFRAYTGLRDKGQVAIDATKVVSLLDQGVE